MQQQECKRNSLLFTIFMIFFEFTNVFALSGFANTVNYNSYAMIFCVAVLVLYLFGNRMYEPISGRILLILFSFFGCIILFSVLMNYQARTQLMNFSTLFMMILWVKLLITIRWENINFYSIGVISSIFALFLIYVFLPGNILSGWNSNSTIAILPILFFGEAAIYSSIDILQKKIRKVVLLGIINIIAIGFLLMLENRSSFYTLVMFLTIMLLYPKINNRKLFRVIYSVVLLINVVFPFAYVEILNIPFVSNFTNSLGGLFDKTSTLNGRELLWNTATSAIADNGLMGTFGMRMTYYHNLSLDIINQFGWVGWILFVAMLIMLMERVFNDSKYNLFAYGFIALIFLNTFENVLVADNIFSIFPYVLLAVPFCLKGYDNLYNKDNDLA